MPFLLLLLLTLTYLQGSYPKPLFGPDQIASIAVTWGGTFVLVAAAAVLSRRSSLRLLSEPIKRNKILRRFSSLRRCHFWGMLGFYLLALYLLGWGWLWAPADPLTPFPSPPGGEGEGVRGMTASLSVPSANMLPGLQIMLLSPFLFALISSWCCFYDVERASWLLVAGERDEPFLSRWSYVGLQARHNLLLVAPPLLPLIIQQTVLYFNPNVGRVFSEVFATFLLIFTFVTIPLVLRLILGLQPLPAGPLRTRLLQAARRAKFRFNDILVWNSRRTMANAMVTGPLPFLRYVVLTDRLIESLTEDEVEAVFGHEMGHVKHHHMLFYLGFLLGSMVALTGVWNIASGWMKAPEFISSVTAHVPLPYGHALAPLVGRALASVFETGATLALITLVSLYVFVVFGFLSRRCERQADIYGCRTVSCDVFVRALEKVASLNGIDPERPGWLSSWQHSTIGRRVRFIRQMSADPAIEPRFQRNLGVLKWAVVFLLAAVLFVLRDYLWTDDSPAPRRHASAGIGICSSASASVLPWLSTRNDWLAPPASTS